MMIAYEVLDTTGTVVRRGEVAEQILPLLKEDAEARGYRVRIPTDT
jgi:hypothetical protein